MLFADGFLTFCMNSTNPQTQWGALTRCGRPERPCSCPLSVCWSAANRSLVLWTFWWSSADQRDSSQNKRNTEKWSPAAEIVLSDTAGTRVTPASQSVVKKIKQKKTSYVGLNVTWSLENSVIICNTHIRATLYYENHKDVNQIITMRLPWVSHVGASALKSFSNCDW